MRAVLLDFLPFPLVVFGVLSPVSAVSDVFSGTNAVAAGSLGLFLNWIVFFDGRGVETNAFTDEIIFKRLIGLVR